MNDYTVARDSIGTPVWYVKDRHGAVVSVHRSEKAAAAAAARRNA